MAVTPGEGVHGLTDGLVLPLRYAATGNTIYESTYWIISLIKPRTRVLDIGCGTGAIAETIVKEREVEILGIEPNRLRANAARRRGLDVVCGVYTKDLPSQHGRFNYVIFADVLEHLEDPSEVLQAVAEALTQDGMVIASVPNIAHWSVRLNLLFGKFDYEASGIMDATHLRWFTYSSLMRLFRKSGYKVEVVRCSSGSWLRQYNLTPVRLLPYKWRPVAIHWLGKLSQGLFACQYIIAARRIDDI